MSHPVVSLADVARRAGASAAAASRTLNGRPGVRQEVRDAVLRAADELGYVPNPAARNLVMRRTGLIAFVVSDRDRIVGTSLFSELVPNVVTSLESADYHTVLLLPREAVRRRDLAKVMRLERFDGVIVVGHRAGDPLLRELVKREVPTVAFGRPVDVPAVSYVDVDNVGGARAATAHLLRTGRNRIGILAGPQDTAWGLDRLQGYRQALTDAGLQPDDDYVEVCEFTYEAGRAGMAALMRRCQGLDGLFVSSESLVHGALAGLKAADIEIPRQMAVVTFDEGPAQAYAEPPLTVVRQPLPAVGGELGRLMLARLQAGSPVQHVVLGAELEIRASTSAAR